MIHQIEKQRKAIEALCHKYHVVQLEVFGSAAGGDFRPGSSDIDFLVRFRRVPEINAFDQYFGLLEELEGLFGCKVDLVEMGAMQNPYFIKRVNESRKLIYAA